MYDFDGGLVESQAGTARADTIRPYAVIGRIPKEVQKTRQQSAASLRCSEVSGKRRKKTLRYFHRRVFRYSARGSVRGYTPGTFL